MKLRLLGKNTFIYGIGNIGLRSTAFLLLPLYTRRLSVNDFGLLATLLITIQFVLIFMSIGMRTTLLRFAGEYKERSSLGSLLGTTTIINLGGGILVTAALMLLLPFYQRVLHTENVRMYVLLASADALIESLYLHVTTYFRAQNEALKFMYAGFASAILVIAITLLFVLQLNMGLIGILLSRIIAYGIIALYLLYSVIGKVGFSFSLSDAQKMIRFGFPLIFSMSGQFLIVVSCTYLLSIFAGLEAVAIYSLGYKIAQLLTIAFIMPFQFAYQPFIFANLDKPGVKIVMSRIFTYLLAAIAFASLIILSGAKIIFPLIAPQAYSDAYSVAILVIPALAIMGVSYYGECFLNITRKTYVTGISVAVCAAGSLLLNYLLIPAIGWYGAVITLNVSYFSISMVILLLGLKAFPVDVEWRRVSIAIGLAASFLLIVYWLREGTTCIFLTGTAIAGMGGALLLYFSGYFGVLEKAYLKNVIHRLRLRTHIV